MKKLSQGALIYLLIVTTGVSWPTKSQAAFTPVPCVGGEDVLLVQAIPPWYVPPGEHPLGASATEITAQGKTFCVIHSVDLPHLNFDEPDVKLEDYKAVVISSAQPQEFYDRLFPGGLIQPILVDYVEQGGVVIANMSDFYNGGQWYPYMEFIGGLTKIKWFVQNNAIADSVSPVITGEFGSDNGGPITDTASFEDIDNWDWSSTGYFTNLPAATHTILTESFSGDNQPVLIEYPYGEGHVIISMTSNEFRYVGGLPPRYSFPVNKKLLANMFGYGFHLAGFNGEPAPVGASNIAFIPGIQASRLYESGQKFWEPGSHSDALQLLMDGNGQSLNPNIHTQDVIDEVPIVGANIYKSFLESLNTLKTEDTINDWQAFPYDWRLDTQAIIEEGVKLPNGETMNLVDELKALASSAKNHKVTIITHSNGALLAKALVNALVEEGETDIVDEIMFIAPPHYGTPKAIASALHGDEQSIVGGLVLQASVARELVHNMMGAYNLLPSAEYFNQVDAAEQPLIEFDPSVDTVGYANIRSHYDNAINTIEELKEYLKGENGQRSDPVASDIFTPAVLLPNLLSRATDEHVQLDAWQAPAGVEVTQVIGWGLDTVRGLKYFANKVFALPGCVTSPLNNCTPRTILDHAPLLTDEGDATVTVGASMNESYKTYYFDLFSNNSGLAGLARGRYQHRDMTEAKPLQDFIAAKIKDELEDTTLPEFISTTKPTTATKTLRLSLHSPLSITITDEQGNQTGIVDIPGSDLQQIQEDIPGSYYLPFGEGKYLGLLDTGTYHILMDGENIGTFTLNLEEVENNQVVASQTFQDIPVSDKTIVSFDVSENVEDINLNLDTNGDGKTDSQVKPGEEQDPVVFLKITEKIIQDLKVNGLLKNSLLIKTRIAISWLERNRPNLAALNIKALIWELNHQPSRLIDKSQAQNLIAILETVLTYIQP